MQKILNRALSYYWTDKIQYNKLFIIGAIFFEVLSKAGNLYLPIVLKYTIDALSNNTQIYSENTLQFIIGYALLWMFNPIAKNLQMTCKNIVSEKSINLLTRDLLAHSLNLPLKFHFDKKTGGLLNSVILLRFYFTIFCDAVLWLFTPLLLEATIAMLLILYFYGMNYAILLFSILILYISLNFLVAKTLVKTQKDLHGSQENLSSFIADILMNFEAVKLFGNEQYIIDKCQNLLKDQRTFARKANLTMELLSIVQNIIIGLGLTSILFLAFTQIQGNKLVLSDFVLLNAYVLQFSIPLSYFTYLFRDSKQAYTILKEGLKVFDEKDEIFKASDSIDISRCDNIGIRFKNICFSYNQSSSVLKDISFDIDPGKTTAIVGPTGAGKSTISRLLFRYFEADRGNILIDNIDIKRISLHSLRECISIIPQDTILFNDSLYENIRFGNPNATQKQVLQAIEIACLDKLMSTLPEGYNTLVGERGIKLSGGERQRIALARAVLKMPKIFIFDEATSSLDSKTENEIQKNLVQICKDITTIIIAHRLSTIVKADKILVLEDGQISESGTHSTLLNKKGTYYRLWKLQLDSELKVKDPMIHDKILARV